MTFLKKPSLVKMRTCRRPGGKRIKPGLEDGKTYRLYRAARELLSENDFEAVSVAHIAKAAGISVGAFYGRFENKHAFLLFLIRNSLLQMTRRAGKEVDIISGQKNSLEKSAQKIAGLLSDQFSNAENAGIIRAAVKLGFSEARAREYFENYRNNIAERAAGILAQNKKPGGDAAAREGIQILFGILTDHVIYSNGNISLGGSCMNRGLGGIIAGYIRATSDKKNKPHADNKPENEIPNKKLPNTIKNRVRNKRTQESPRRPEQEIKSPEELFEVRETDVAVKQQKKRIVRIL